MSPDPKKNGLAKQVDRVLWGLLCAVCFYAAQEVRDLSNNVVELKVTLSTQSSDISMLKSGFQDHETRIRALEQIGPYRTPANHGR